LGNYFKVELESWKNLKKEKLTFAQRRCVKLAGKAMQLTNMIKPNARVGVAISGGVDSFVLLKTLTIRQRIVPFNFQIMALHLNPGFNPENHKNILPWLKNNGIASHIELTDYGIHAHSEENLRNSPCFRCAWLRRKRLFELCNQYKLTHLAFGHNADDLVHTFFMNMCQNGRVDGLSMSEDFFAGKLRVIRPLLLVEKKFIVQASRQWALPIWANTCPSAGKTKRSQIETSLDELYTVYKDAKNCVYNALCRWQLNKNKD